MNAKMRKDLEGSTQHWKVSIKLNLRDIWVGVYWKNRYDIYVCPLPCLVINIHKIARWVIPIPDMDRIGAVPHR